MASSHDNHPQATRGYANITMPSRNEEDTSPSFQDDINTLTSMLQRGKNSDLPNSTYQSREEAAMNQDRGEISNLFDQRDTFRNQPQFWGNYGQPSPMDQQWIQQAPPPPPPPPPPPMNPSTNNLLTHHCSICNVSCNHEIAYQQHLAGKKHLKKAALMAGGDVAVLHNNSAQTNLIPSNGYSSFNSNAIRDGAQMNVMPNGSVGFPPQYPAAVAPLTHSNIGESDGKIDDVIPNQSATSHTQPKNRTNEQSHEVYHCLLCNIVCNHEMAYKQHLEGKRHQKQFARFGGSAVAIGSSVPPPPPPPPPPPGAPPLSDPRIKPPTIVAGLQSQLTTDPRINTTSHPKIQELITDPRQKQPSPPETEPSTDIDEESEEEGEIDEAEEDIGHLYNDFEESVPTEVVTPSSVREKVDSVVDADIHDMFGDEEDVKCIDEDESEVDSDIDEMFGEADDSGANTDATPSGNNKGYLHSTESNNAYDQEMFGESSDEEGQVAAGSKSTPKNSIVSSKANVNASEINSTVQDEDDIDMFGSDDADDNDDSNPKSVSFCTAPPLTENKAEPKVPLTSSEALAAARRRASIPTVAKPDQGVKSLLKKMTPATHRSSISSASSTTQGLKPKSLLKNSAPRLAKLRKAGNADIASQKADASVPKRSYYQNIHPDKFWSTLRNWDFVREFNDAMKRGNHLPKKKDGDTTNENKKRPLDDGGSQESSVLPDSFDSVAHYRSLWAPLLIDEAKAQLLSEAVSAQSSQATAWMNGSRLVTGVTAKVELSRTARDLDGRNAIKSAPIETTAVLHVRSISRGAGIGCPVSPNDLILFVREASVIELALRGMALKNTDVDDTTKNSILGMSKGRLGFIGHALNHRSRTVDGLLVRASQQMWNQFSSLDELFCIRIGSNVTALREFNALIRLDEVPLSKYLLDGKNDSTEVEHSKGDASGNDTKFDPLSQSGLPVGFRIFIKSKMNTSQLQAITASSKEYGSGGFTLIKGPPGTGKSTTLVSILNALHLRQYQEYYESIERIVTESDASSKLEELALLNKANEVKPRILVCAPSNAAIDNVVAKVMSEKFVDGNGSKYSPSIVRVGAGIVSDVAKKVSLQGFVNSIIQQGADSVNLESIVNNGRKKLKQMQHEIQKLKVRIQGLVEACPYEICEDWEVRIMEESNDGFRILFVNHKSKTTTFDIPPKRRPTEKACRIKQLPHYIALLKSLTKFVERHNNESSTLEKYIILQNHAMIKRECEQSEESSSLFQELETHVLNSSHIVLTTLGSAGSRAIEAASKFEVIVIDEAAQSSEMSTLLALQLGSSHAILVGDPQQLPATIFSMSGRNNKYDRSLFQRLEECRHPVVMLNTQYRMNPMISEFPRHIFYKGTLTDGPNVQASNFGGDLKDRIAIQFPHFKPFTIFDLDSREEREGTGLSNMHEAQLAVHLYMSLDNQIDGLISKSRVAVITPYAQQAQLLHKLFEDALGASYSARVEISTVDAFQGREAGVVIYSCVRAGGKGSGIGFLSDVQRMNVALTRAKYFLFIIARRRSIMINHYWRNLVGYAREKKSLIHVPTVHQTHTPKANQQKFPNLAQLIPVASGRGGGYSSDSEYSA